ncbi:MAG: hypothetical protein GTO02_14120, partial [Candidatus Dadabacteria bacterium]|nr:hypothetical protein [Candidatus Dadabacteria bacterium]
MKKFTEWLNEQPIQSPAVRPRPEAAESARISSALRNLIQAEIQTGLRDPSYGLSREDVIAVLEYLTEGTPPEAGQWTEPQRRFFEEVKKW